MRKGYMGKTICAVILAAAAALYSGCGKHDNTIIASPANNAETTSLNEYPDQFIDDNGLTAKLVVGDNAPSEDTLSAIEIMTGLQYDMCASGIQSDCNSIPVASAILTSEALATAGTGADVLKDYSYIIIGNPCQNALAYYFLEMPLSVNCLSGFEEGKAKIIMKQFGDNVSMLVAGYSGTDTLRAARAIKIGKLETVLDGASEVSVATVTSQPPLILTIERHYRK